MKAILILDAPKMCDKCPLINGIHCMVTREEIEDPWGEIDKNCPLKSMPRKMAVEHRWYSEDFAEGYNKCIDEILG